MIFSDRNAYYYSAFKWYKILDFHHFLCGRVSFLYLFCFIFILFCVIVKLTGNFSEVWNRIPLMWNHEWDPGFLFIFKRKTQSCVPMVEKVFLGMAPFCYCLHVQFMIQRRAVRASLLYSLQSVHGGARPCIIPQLSVSFRHGMISPILTVSLVPVKWLIGKDVMMC